MRTLFLIISINAPDLIPLIQNPELESRLPQKYLEDDGYVTEFSPHVGGSETRRVEVDVDTGDGGAEAAELFNGWEARGKQKC